MKRRIAMLLVVLVTALTFMACGKFECDFCGKEKTGKSYTVSAWGEEAKICKDCKDGMNELKSMFD